MYYNNTHTTRIFHNYGNSAVMLADCHAKSTSDFTANTLSVAYITQMDDLHLMTIPIVADPDRR